MNEEELKETLELMYHEHEKLRLLTIFMFIYISGKDASAVLPLADFIEGIGGITPDIIPEHGMAGLPSMFEEIVNELRNFPKR